MRPALDSPTAPGTARSRSRSRPSPLWAVRADIPRRLYLLAVCLSILVPLGAWIVLSTTGHVDALFMPTPLSVWQAALRLAQSGDLVNDSLASISRVMAGFLLSAAIAVPLGLLIGTFKFIEGLFEPMLGLIRYMPAAAFIPLIILWIGLDEPAKIAIIFIGSFFYNTLMVADAVKFVPADWLKVSYTLGAGRRDAFFRIILPATLPNIIDTLRINIATAWNFVVVAELIAANSGLGYRILISQRFLKTDEIFVGILLIGLIGLAIDAAFKGLFRLLVPWAVDR
ncbi:ABC transporter permease [Gloeobacter kilaueensis]|uniref:Binding-protein-dependent transport systems inner membrane component n=1 Tax=Gloeobacter kilaueensis (strain ATCC BAA-2537 / CCAP 1431/1 / ULC 316 / JS1) TaxID=1183438 RepID=U5QPQ7_GLOK1|nr:ABC transporter permease [Gloeobacter kilaueensis]AGY59680.1 binding-protein-dependent transport systems inner membrane component [Gloeobacter kilaueensis JS1]